MSRMTITLEIDASHESLLREYAAFLAEMKQLAVAAPHGAVLDTCEKAVLQQGREHQRRALELAVEARVQDAEKKGRRCDGATAESPARIAGSRPERFSHRSVQ